MNVKQFDVEAKKVVKEILIKNTYIMENPVDLINSAIDVPAYSFLDRFALEIRTTVHNGILTVLEYLSDKQKKILDMLLDVGNEKNFSDLKYLKDPEIQ